MPVVCGCGIDRDGSSHFAAPTGCAVPRSGASEWGLDTGEGCGFRSTDRNEIHRRTGYYNKKTCRWSHRKLDGIPRVQPRAGRMPGSAFYANKVLTWVVSGLLREIARGKKQEGSQSSAALICG